MNFDGTGRNATKTIKLTERTKARLDAHNRDSETLGGTIDRALDALEREGELPDAVRARLRGGGEPPSKILRRVERLAEAEDSALGYGDVLTVVQNNRPNGWITDRLVPAEKEVPQADE